MKEFVENLVGPGEAAEAIAAEHGRIVADLEGRIRAMGVDYAVKQAVTAAGGRNLTAIRAILDENAIAQAENPQTAAQMAVAQAKRENPYLFAGVQVSAPGTGTGGLGGGYTMEEIGKMSLADYRRYRKG